MDLPGGGWELRRDVFDAGHASPKPSLDAGPEAPPYCGAASDE